MSYILKISVESRALLSCYDLEKIERMKINKRVHIDLMDSKTSHIKSMILKSCLELANIDLVIVAINRK